MVEIIIILLILITVYFAAANINKSRVIKNQLISRTARAEYIANLRQENNELKQLPTIVVLPEFGHVSFDERHDICYAVPVYKN